MAEKPRRSKKKSKDYDSDSSDDDIEEFVNKEINDAMKEVSKAMKDAKLARKEGKKAQKAFKVFQGTEGMEKKSKYGGGYTQINTVNHMGTMINIQNAQNVQVGNNNLMVVSDKGKRSRRKSSESRDTTEEDRQREEEERRQAEMEERFKDILESARLVTVEDFTKACTHVTNWRRYLRNIGMSDSEIEHLHQDHHIDGVREVMIQGSLLWKQKLGRDATLSAFAKVLVKLKQFDAIQELKIDYKLGKQTTV